MLKIGLIGLGSIFHSKSSRGELDVHLPTKVTTQTTESTG